MSMYEWRDPWAAIEQVERFERDWYDREDEHRSQMRGMAMAFADSSHELQRRMDAAYDPILRAKMLQPQPAIYVSSSELARFGATNITDIS
jgi:hypothetical protein